MATTSETHDIKDNVGETQDHIKAPISETLTTTMWSKNIDMTPSSELSSESKNTIKMPITSQTCGTIMANSTSNIVTFDTDKQQELLDLITNLCYMQASVVTMVITASIILDQLNMIPTLPNIPTSQPILGSDLPVHVKQDGPGQGGKPPPQSEQVLPVVLLKDNVQQVISVSSVNVWNVTPWKRKGIVYSKLF